MKNTPKLFSQGLSLFNVVNKGKFKDIFDISKRIL